MHPCALGQRQFRTLARIGMAGFQPQDLARGQLPGGGKGLVKAHAAAQRIIDRLRGDEDPRAAPGVDKAAGGEVGQRAPDGMAIDFAAVARAAGIRNVRKIDRIDDFENALPALLSEDGPVFAEIMIEQGPLGPRSYEEMYSPARRRKLRETLGA